MKPFYDFSLYGLKGERKYLDRQERARFYVCTNALPLERQLFCLLMYYTGGRISEISMLKIRQLYLDGRSVIIRTLKRRRTDVYRQVPLPDHVIHKLTTFLDNRKDSGLINSPDDLLWSFCTRTASRIIKRVMNAANIYGIQSSSLGLRHGFAVHVVTRVPLTQVQKWMGHADIKTTAIYLQVSGIEEREWAERCWDEEE